MAQSSETVANWRAGIGGELLSEFLGTFCLLAFGAGVVAVAVVGLTGSGRTPAIFVGAGDWLLITWGWALAVTMAVYVAGGPSGAHLNPAVTLAFAVRGDHPWHKVLPYWLAQVLGAFCGAAIVYADYYPAINAWNAAHKVTSRMDPSGAAFGIFGTGPAAYFNGNMVGPWGSSQSRSTPDRFRRGCDRHVVWRRRGLRDQSGARLRTTSLLLLGRLGA